MGQLFSSKMANDGEIETSDEAIVDISRRLVESAEDDGVEKYKKALTCKTTNRIASDKTTVTCTISGEESRHLTVQIGNKLYHNSPLPKAATDCEANIKKLKDVDLLFLHITKAEPGWWVQKK